MAIETSPAGNVSATTPASETTTVTGLPGANLSQRVLLIGIVGWVSSALVLLYFHFAGVLVKAHYQYMLLVPPVMIWLFWHRASTQVLKSGKGSVWLLCGLLIPWLGLLYSSWVFSPWLGMAALALVGPLASFALGGWPLFRSTWGIWLIGFFLLPLPLRYDERLIVRLRDYATRITSSALDELGVVHMISGNVIELPEKKLFVADACSGIHSLFVVIAAAAVIAAFNRRGPLATLVLMAGAFGIVMIENIARLTSVALSIRFGYDLSEGMPHQILGVVLFAISIGLLISLDQWVAFFSFFRFRTTESEPPWQPFSPALTRVFAVSGVLCLVCLPVQFLRMPKEVPSLAEGFAKPVDLPSLSKELLPSELADFTQTEYEEIVRVADDPFGPESQVWRYVLGDKEMVFSLNYPYRGLHDACLCYRNSGWQVRGDSVVGVPDTGAATHVVPPGTAWNETPALVSRMSNPVEGEAILMYSMLSESGRVGVLIDSRKLGSGIAQAGSRFQSVEYSVPEQWIQLQATLVSPAPLSQAEQETFQELFRQVQQLVFERCSDEF